MTTATATRRRRTKLYERVASKPGRVDKKAGIIFDVKVLGFESRNGRTYSREAIRQARFLYEDIPVNIDHPDRREPLADRALLSRFGTLRNVRLTDTGLVAELHYLKAHPLAEMVVEAAERMPSSLGLSHNAEGEMVRRNGKMIVDEIVSVRSVDLVTDPASTVGLFEGIEEARRLAVQEVLAVMDDATLDDEHKMAEIQRIIKEMKAREADDVDDDVEVGEPVSESYRRRVRESRRRDDPPTKDGRDMARLINNCIGWRRPMR